MIARAMSHGDVPVTAVSEVASVARSVFGAWATLRRCNIGSRRTTDTLASSYRGDSGNGRRSFSFSACTKEEPCVIQAI